MDMSFLPYPPPPEPGWYDDDAMVSDRIVRTTVSDARNVDGFRRSSDIENPVDAIDGDDIDRDGTVLASSFAMRTTPVYLLRNEQTGQEVPVDGNVLLGREPSAASEGAKAVGLKDPTRTISRNHAVIGLQRDGTLRIQDCGSLNGTYIIHDDVETKVGDDPVALQVPSVVRIGDQFYALERRAN